MTDTARLLECLLVFAVFPLWMLAGVADWLCHRASHIERTSGSPESRFHLALYLQIALPAAAVTFLQVTMPVLLLLAAGVLAHFVTSWADTRYAQGLRFISPFEQRVHAFLEMLPLFALLILGVLSAEQFTHPQWHVAARKPEPAAAWALVAALCAGAGFILEEWWRCAVTLAERAGRPG